MLLLNTGIIKYFKLIFFICLVSISLSCTKSYINKNENLRFAIISNTRAQSPYSGLEQRLHLAIRQIEEENPVFLLHLGCMICAGTEWQGITKSDMERQYKEFYSLISGLFPIFYTVKAGSDLINNSSDHYHKYSNKKDYYSFNYGNLHFLVLDSSSDTVKKEQLDWIIKDLKYYKNSAGIFVFIHDPIFIPEKNKLTEPIIQYKDNELLHKYFKKYPVKTVFSGSHPIFFKSDKDGISYINTGCGGYNKEDISKGYAQYYMAEYNNGVLLVRPKYLNSR